MNNENAFKKNASFYISIVCNVTEGMLAGFNFVVLFFAIEALMTEQLTKNRVYQIIFLLSAVFIIHLMIYAYGYTKGQIGGADVSRHLRLTLLRR